MSGHGYQLALDRDQVDEVLSCSDEMGILDWATFGKVRFLKPDEVRDVADALSQISVEDLQARFDPIAFTKAEVYPNPRPGGWDAEQLEPL